MPERAILHVDMDAFYASVEQRDDPSLRGKPLIVGGHRTRGVVLAASYEARPFGVRSAMPMARALKLAPEAIVVPPRFSAYAEASERVFSIFESFTPLVEPLSLDEAFLDVSASIALFGSPWEMALRIRERIAGEVGLPASAGIAEVKFAAKVASDLAKPNGQREVPPGKAREFLAPLPVGRLWGVGPKTEAVLKSLGIETIGDLAGRDEPWVERHLGAGGGGLRLLAQGIDDRAVVPDREAKSLGAEDTFEEDLEGIAPLLPHLHDQSWRVARRLRRADLLGGVVRLKVKFSDFRVVTRRLTLPAPTNDGQALYRNALKLIDRVPRGRAVRLTGVAVEGLERGGGQLPLFDAGAAKAGRLNVALDRIASRYGSGVVTTADLVGAPEDDEARRGTGASRLDAPPADRSLPPPRRRPGL